MLYPCENECREKRELSGFWDYRFDWREEGVKKKWYEGFVSEGDMPVPASWNELFTDDARKHFFGTCWYQTKTLIPAAWAGKKVWIRVGAVNYRATVWVNGKKAGAYEGCHLPFEFSIERFLEFGKENLIVIAVNAALDKNTIPPGNMNLSAAVDAAGAVPVRPQPDVPFDFFPYGGIHRPVVLYTTGRTYIEDLTVTTDIHGTAGVINCTADICGKNADRLVVEAGGVKKESRLDGARGAVQLTIPKARFWAPESPRLYSLTVSVYNGTERLDTYRLPVGIRTVTVTDSRILINGKPVFLKGFGKHEDFPVLGKGLNHAVIKRDFELMKWIGANSFRTSHYPYAEEVLDMADREGFMVISETAAVGIGVGEFGNKLLENHKKALTGLMRRDKNHPSVIMWSIANEPASQKKESGKYFKPLVDLTRRLDPTRPLTIVSCDGPWIGRKKCNVMKFCDVLCINRYYGWYISQGRVEEAITNLDAELDALHKEFNRPVIMTEYGGDCVAGQHTLPASIWSEEYQSELIEKTMKVMHAKPFMAGDHIWNFADFMTAQNHLRVVGNKKGVFTRDRQPKMSAHTVKRMWAKKKK